MPDTVSRLGIIGGSFDPPHLAHLLMAETVREALRLNLVLFLPAAQQPLKAGKPATAVEHRLAMTRLAIENNDCFGLSSVDIERPGPSYTADTLRLLRNQWGENCPMWFIIGADSLATLPKWRDPAGIIQLSRLAVVRRPGVTVDIEALERQIPGVKEGVDWVDAPLVDISSTDIRQRVRDGRSIRYRVPEAVREYIEANRLYR